MFLFYQSTAVIAVIAWFFNAAFVAYSFIIFGKSATIHAIIAASFALIGVYWAWRLALVRRLVIDNANKYAWLASELILTGGFLLFGLFTGSGIISRLFIEQLPLFD